MAVVLTMMSTVVRRSRHSAGPVEVVMSAVVHRSRTCAYPVIVVTWSVVSNMAELMDLSWFEHCGRDCLIYRLIQLEKPTMINNW